MNLYDLVNPLTFAEAKASAKKSQDKDLYKTTKYADTRKAIDAARKEYPGANDVEALAAHSWKTDQLNQQQQQQIDQLQKQEKDLYKQIDSTNKFVQDKERRFQDFTQKVAGMDLTPPEQARAAQDIERGEDPKVTQKPKDLFNPVTGTPKASTKPAQTRTAPTFIVPRTSSTAAEPQQVQQPAQEPTAQTTQEPTASPALGQMANQLTQTPGRVVSPKQQLAQYQTQPATNWAANQPTVQPKPTTGAGKVKDLGTARQQKAASLLNLVGGQKVAEAVNPTPFVKQVADDNLQKFVNAYVANHDTVDIEAPGSLIPIKIKRKQIKGVMDILSAMPDSETKKTLVLNLFGNPSYLLQFIHEYLTNKGAYVKPVSDPNQGELEEGGMKDLAIQGRAVPDAAGYHTVCKRVGADWVPIKSHESQDLAQRHAQAIKTKYPGMQIGVRDPANKYTMVGLEEDSWYDGTNDWSSEHDQWAKESADPVIALTGVDEDSSDFMANDSASPIGGNMKFENDFDDGEWEDDPDPRHHAVVSRQAKTPVLPDHINRAIAQSPQYRNEIIADYERKLKQGVAEGYQDFKKVEPYAVCLAGKPVKQFDYYEQARQFHDNWKKKLYAQGEKAKADSITLNPVMKEAGSPAQQAAIAIDKKEHGVEEALSKKDLLKQIGDKLNDPEFRKQPADSSKRWEKGDLYQGPGPDEYGYTGYQGHGMPTDKAERARIRADKKKGVAEAVDPQRAKAGKVINRCFGKIYDHGDSGLEYLDRNAPVWFDLFNDDQYDGDIDTIVANAPIDLLVKSAQELLAVVSDLPYELDEVKQRLDAKCWTGKHKEGTKIKGGVRVNNCVPNESVEEATGDTKFDTVLSRIKKDPWTQLNSDPKFEEKLVDLVYQYVEPFLDKMDQMGVPLTTDDQTLNPAWKKAYKQMSTKLAQKFLKSRKVNPNDPDLVNKIRAYIDWHTNELDSVHGQLSAYSNDLPMHRHMDTPAADQATADLRDQMWKDQDPADPNRLDPGNMEESYAKLRAKGLATKRDRLKSLRKESVKESYWTKLQNEKNKKLNSLVDELKESIK